MNRTVEKIENLESRLRKFKDHQSQIAEDVQADFFEESDEEDEDLARAFQVGGKLKFQMAHLRIDDLVAGFRERQTTAFPSPQ